MRDSFDLGDRLLIVATDRLSAFDVILPTPFDGKGPLLSRLSVAWFEWSRNFLPNHFLTTDLASLPLTSVERSRLAGRSMIVRKAERIDIECVVRGFLAGSAWQEYNSTGTIHGEPAPRLLGKGQALPSPRFTPAIKRDEGHDENISRVGLKRRVGAELAERLEACSLQLYTAAATAAKRAGFLLADTKFEFGYVDGALAVIDELLTPDSSRYWDEASFQVGTELPSFDKQIVRDWLVQTGWDKRPPGPNVPPCVVAETMDRYRAVEERILSEIRGGTSLGGA